MKSARRRIVNHKAVFKARTPKEDNDELSQELIIATRKSGVLDLSKRGLHTVPEKVWCINEPTEEEEVKTIFNLTNASTETIPWWEQETLKKLDLSCNSIKVVDSKISCLADLQILYLNDNILEQLPSTLGALKNLKDLNLSSNKLNNLDPSVYELVELKILNLKNNLLESLSPSIGDLVMLENLDISHNNLLTLPVGLGYLVRLKSLNFSHNKLKDIPPDITNMRALKSLDLSFNCIKTSPPLGDLRKVENIFLQDNQLIEFPDINGCVELRNLYLSNNQIKEIEAEKLDSLGKLKNFIIKNNEIGIIPEEIIKLINLEQFDISHNKLSQLPHSISSMPNLRNFNIDGNESLNIRRDIVHCGTWRILQHLREKIDHSFTESLNSTLLGETGSEFPDKYAMKHSKLLSLVARNISEIPTSVFENAKEAEVTCIDLNKNKLQELPDALSLVKTVLDLKISCNSLKLLPEWFGESLINLRFIDLSKNQLSTLPTSLNCLQYLIEVNISFNRFTSLPESLYEVPTLQILIANDNQIEAIDALSLKNLKKLATLDLSNNNISYVPPELGNLQNIRSLQLHGNCFKQPRQATLMRGTDAIMTYLRDRIPTPR